MIHPETDVLVVGPGGAGRVLAKKIPALKRITRKRRNGRIGYRKYSLKSSREVA